MSGTQVCSLAVCVNTRQKVNGEWSDKANWVDVVFFGNRAESIAKYLAKGSHVTIAGRLSQNTWETKEGQKRSKLEVIGEDIDFQGGKRTGQAAEDQPADVYDDDCPF